MNLYHLKYFYDSARLKSISGAAKLNSVGQPAVSKAIQNLESSFRKSLLSHERNRFQLTDEGEKVFSLCHKIFSATDELSDAVRSESSFSGEIRLACPSSMAESHFLASTLNGLMTKYPGIDFKLTLGRTDLVKEWVASGTADFGVVLDHIDLAGLETHSLAQGCFQLVKSPKYKGDWHKDGVLTVEAKKEVLELRQNYRSKTGRPLRSKLEIGSWGVIKRFVLSQMGVGFLPDFMIGSEIKNKTLVLVEPKNFSIKFEIKIIRDPKRFFSNKCRAVIDEFVRNARLQ